MLGRQGLAVLLLLSLTSAGPGCANRSRADRPVSPEAALAEDDGGAVADDRATVDDLPEITEAEAFVEVAEDALNEGNEVRAMEAFTRALEVNPELVEARLGRGNLYRDQGDYARAQRDFDRASQTAPRNYEAHYMNGLMLQLLDRITEAIRAYRRALSVEPGSHEANLNLAVAYLQSGQPSEALPFAERAQILLPAHGATRANLGLTYAALGRHPDAIEQYQAALELMEPSPELVLNLVESLKRERRYAEMANALEALVRERPSPPAWERLGFAYFKLQRYSEAEEAYRNAVALDDTYYPAMNGVGVILLNRWIDSSRTDRAARTEALDWLRRSLQVKTNQPRITQLLTRYGAG